MATLMTVLNYLAMGLVGCVGLALCTCTYGVIRGGMMIDRARKAVRHP